MTVLDLRQQPLQGTALYNPHLHGKNELLSLFVVRQKLLDHLLEDLRATDAGKSPQHHLILGQRGMGKTMLLRRLGYAIEDDPTLRDGWLPLTFPEEQYNIARLSDFWLNCIDSLSDLLEGQGRHEEAEKLDERAAALRSNGEEQRARQALGLLVGAAQNLGKRLVLLVDNVDLVFDRVREQDWTLREVLSSEPALVMIGASANAIESSFAYDQAFYDFFRVHELEGLSFEETQEFLARYAETWGAPEVKKVAEQEQGRVKVLHTLTGGNPRTIVLLFNVLSMGVEGDVRTDLERLLDQSTPLYKARFEALSTQAQQIVHAMAVHWDPISAGELTESLGWEVNAVSAQLNRLVKQGTVEKVAYDPENKTGFQISERFFNIWYLMRASRRLRRRLIWLVEFLKVFYSQDELRGRAARHIHSALDLKAAERLRYAEYSFALADAIADQTWRSSLEKTGLHAILKDDILRGRLAELIDLEEGDSSLKGRVVLQERFDQAKSKSILIDLDLPDWSGEDFWGKLKDSLLLPLREKVLIAERISELNLELIKRLKSKLDSEAEILKDLYICPQTIEVLTQAVQSGLMMGPDDREGAIHAEPALGTRGLEAIALAYAIELNGKIELLYALESVLDTTTSPFPWLVWIRRSLEAGEQPTSMALGKAVKEFLARAGSSGRIFAELGQILLDHGRFVEAEQIWRRASELQPANVQSWVQLGRTLQQLRRYKEAEEATRKAIELDPEMAVVWAFLGVILAGNCLFEEAEQAFRRALALDSQNAGSWSGLGVALEFQDRLSEAEEAYRHALEIVPDHRALKLQLAWFLLRREDFRSADDIARELPEEEGETAGIIATTLAYRGNWNGAAIYARRFISTFADQDIENHWPYTVVVLRAAVRSGKSREAAELLEEAGAAERWRPLREALEAIARGSESYLRRVAPEIRSAARQLFRELQAPPPQTSDERTHLKRGTSKRRKA